MRFSQWRSVFRLVDAESSAAWQRQPRDRSPALFVDRRALHFLHLHLGDKRLDVVALQNVTEEGSVRFGILAIDDDVSTMNHGTECTLVPRRRPTRRCRSFPASADLILKRVDIHFTERTLP